MAKIFVGGFPLDVEEMDLVMLVAPHGDVSTIKIVRDKKTRKCKGYAFIEMASEEGAEQAAIALDGYVMDGRELSVKMVYEDLPKTEFVPENYRKVLPHGQQMKPKRPRRPS